MSLGTGTDEKAKYNPRNFFYGVANGVLYISAETLLDPTLVLVTFLSGLTQSPILLGMLVPIRDGTWYLPQLWVSTHLQSMPSKIEVYRKTTFLRIATWGLLALVINLVRDPGWLLPLFFLTYVMATLSNGLAGLPFLEVVGNVISPVRRGEFFAWRLGLGGLGGIFSAMLVRRLLDPASSLDYPLNFGLLSILFFVISSISLLVFNKVKEDVETRVVPPVSLRYQISRGLDELKRNPAFRRYLMMQSSLVLSAAAIPFFAVFVQQQYDVSKAMVGVYLAVFTASNLMSNIIWGRLSRRLASRQILWLASLAGVIMTLLVLSLSLIPGSTNLTSQIASVWLIPVFVMAGLRGSGIGVSGTALLLDIAPPESRSLYLGFSNSFLGIILLLTGMSGVLVKVFNYQTLFVVSLLAHLLAISIGYQLNKKAGQSS